VFRRGGPGPGSGASGGCVSCRARSQPGYVARSSGSPPTLSGNAPVSKVPEHEAEAFAVVQAPAPVSFLNLLEARYARLPRRTALHYDGRPVAVLHPINGKRHQDPEFLDKRG
jgi:hypothetical protein